MGPGPVDLVVTLCAAAAERCPELPGVSRWLHWGLDDPAAVRGDERRVMAAFRRTRDEIRARVEGLAAELRAGD